MAQRSFNVNVACFFALRKHNTTRSFLGPHRITYPRRADGNLYSALADPRLENSWGETYIVNGIDAYTIICGGVAASFA
jgi:hypothetical protein